MSMCMMDYDSFVYSTRIFQSRADPPLLYKGQPQTSFVTKTQQRRRTCRTKGLFGTIMHMHMYMCMYMCMYWHLAPSLSAREPPTCACASL